MWFRHESRNSRVGAKRPAHDDQGEGNVAVCLDVDTLLRKVIKDHSLLQSLPDVQKSVKKCGHAQSLFRTDSSTDRRRLSGPHVAPFADEYVLTAFARHHLESAVYCTM